MRKKGNMKIILIILFVVALIYFSYSTFQEDTLFLDPPRDADSNLSDLSYTETFVWNLYDPINDTYELFVTQDEDYDIAPGFDQLHSFMTVEHIKTRTRQPPDLLDTRITQVNATMRYFNLSTDISYDVEIHFLMSNISSEIHDRLVTPSFDDEFAVKMQVTRMGELVPIVKGSELQPNDLVQIHIQSIQGHEYQQDATITFQLEILEYLT